ncbi:hypothetical protein H8356DRAFT_1438665 [Neocallimastix lanati (nom. inval.)]|nr:hypothetical protein H8356DRAFT_1438665 [Neocallimastix sp. JGI-2020a]
MLSCIEASSNIVCSCMHIVNCISISFGLAITFKLCTFVGKRCLNLIKEFSAIHNRAFQIWSIIVSGLIMYIVRFPSLFSKQDTFTKLDEDGEHRFIAGSGDYICFLNGCFHFEDRACQIPLTWQGLVIGDHNKSFHFYPGSPKINYTKERVVLLYNQIISGYYSKISSLVKTSALFTEIMPRSCIRQDRANASEGEDPNFFQIVYSNPNPTSNDKEKKGNFDTDYNDNINP